MNPEKPYNTTSKQASVNSMTVLLMHFLALVNNFFGRQFNSLNDVSINPRNGDIYFTDTQYGYWQHFRPEPGLQNQVYRLNLETGAVTVVADGFVSPNG